VVVAGVLVVTLHSLGTAMAAAPLARVPAVEVAVVVVVVAVVAVGGGHARAASLSSMADRCCCPGGRCKNMCPVCKSHCHCTNHRVPVASISGIFVMLAAQSAVYKRATRQVVDCTGMGCTCVTSARPHRWPMEHMSYTQHFLAGK